MTDYIKSMRKLVGHAPIIQCGASVIIVRGEEVLLQLRADNHMWAYHGGSVELDEDVETTARRELKEETGLIANSLELFGVFSGKPLHYIYPNGDEVSNIDVVYICRDFSGEPKPQNGEVMELKWFNKNALPDNISPPTVTALMKFARQ